GAGLSLAGLAYSFRGHGGLPDDCVGGLVTAQPAEYRVANAAGLGPLSERHFRDKFGADPMGGFVYARGRGEWIRRRVELVQLLLDGIQNLAVEAAADISSVLQGAVGVMDTQKQRPYARAGTHGVGIAANNEFLAHAALEFDPVIAPPGDVRRRFSFAYDAFQPHLAGRCNHVPGTFIEACAEPDGFTPGARGRAAQHSFQALAPFHQ